MRLIGEAFPEGPVDGGPDREGGTGLSHCRGSRRRRSARPADRSARVALPATHDIVSGLINSVFIIVLTVSYAVLIFSGSLAALLPVGIGYVAGMAVGIIAACVIFAISSSRIRVVKRGLSRSEFGSRVDRPAEQLKQLLEHGSAIRIVWLHGFLFFGSTNSLVEELKQIVTADSSGKGCRMFVLDFHQVLGIDSSAVDSLRKLRQFAEREGLFIAVSDLAPAVRGALRSGGFCAPSDAVCQESMPRSNGARRSSLPNLVSRTTRCAPPMSGWHARWAAKRNSIG
jgi:STAS domain